LFLVPFFFVSWRMTSRKIILYIILLITFAVAAYVVLVVVPTRLAQRTYEGAKQIGKDIGEAFNVTPEITVNNTVVIQQQSPVFELATLSQKFQHQYRWTNTWLGSTKQIKITGSFDAKVGFDLDKRFAIEINEKKAVVTLPPPRVLSLESMGDILFEDEHGVWNWVNTDDRSKAINAFQSDARRYADAADFVPQAKTEAEKKITAILKNYVEVVEFRYATESVRIEKR
jgi:hypothetical protein